MRPDPLHVPAALRDGETDYQWFSVDGPRDPTAGGWVAVSKPEMPGFHVEHKELRLYKRPMAVTEHVRAQEREVAERLIADAGDFARYGGVAPRPVAAKIVTTPLGSMSLPWSLRRWLIYLAMDALRGLDRATPAWLVRKFYRTTQLGLDRWAEENRMPTLLYLETLAGAAHKGRGRWLGPIVMGRPR